MIYGKKSRIHFVTGKGPVRKIMNSEGLVVKEKLPGVRFVRKFVGPCGTIFPQVFADGKSVGSFNDDAMPEVTDPDNSHALMKWRNLLKGGALLYSECPYANGSLKGKKACKGHDGNGRFWKWTNRKAGIVNEEECCEHITEIALKRQEAQAKKTAELAEQFESSDAKLMRQLLKNEQERLRQLNTDATQRLKRAGADVKG